MHDSSHKGRWINRENWLVYGLRLSIIGKFITSFFFGKVICLDEIEKWKQYSHQAIKQKESETICSSGRVLQFTHISE